MFESIKMDAGYLICCEGQRPALAYLLAVMGLARHLLALVVCKVRGHRWIDESCVGPDSGDMAMRCDRCGESHRTILY